MRYFSSVIIPTIGRQSLSRAVMSVLDQQFDAAPFEVIVVNDAGSPLPAAAWQRSERVTVLQTNRRERSFARNSGAAVARGAFLYFLDDDDWLLPGALAAFWELAQRAPQAAWLHGGIRIVGQKGTILAERNSRLEGNCLAQIMGGAWIPIQASLISAKQFFAVGGYDPFIRGTEDQDLCRKIGARGPLANTSAVVACLFRGDNWQTSTDYGRAAQDTRRSRDNIIRQPNILRKLLASANESYWVGRIVHLYLSLALWRLSRRRLFGALSCALHGSAALLYSLPSVLRAAFWKALRDDHVPGSLHFIQLEWERAVTDHDVNGAS